VLTDNLLLSKSESEISAEYSGEIAPENEIVCRMIIGYSFEHGESKTDKICSELLKGKFDSGLSSAYCKDWKRIIPEFQYERDETLRRELMWHTYNLESMATYSEYYGETKIPQGTIYDYDWGCHASARDNFQHALPLVYYNPALAKSTLRYMMKRTTPFGEIRLIEVGNGYADNERYFTSDQQLYFFMLLSEYLRVTKDFDFLAEKIEPFPAHGQTKMPVIRFAEKCFTFLRDTVGKGEHGLVQLLNSDWNDAVYYIEKAPYNNIFFGGESHMNTAMAISIFQDFIPLMKKAKCCKKLRNYAEKIDLLCKSMENYRSEILNAFFLDMGERNFPKRMYFNGKSYGDSNMFLEPQGFTLQINELSDERKKTLYGEMQKRVYDGEKLGAREQEAPEFEDDSFDKGSRENGGFWWALNGPVIIGVSQFDKSEARRLLKNMTLQHLSEEFPQYWSSYWSAADNLESSLIPEEGLPDQSLTYANIPVYCAHPHAWILYCYYKINE
jgi:cellobiose phosphorylase